MTETKGMRGTIESGDVSETVPTETVASCTGAEAIGSEALTKPFKMRKRIGNTTYEVEARFNPAF